MSINSGQKGFTIVELLIVIVVIAILAAISIVAYSGIQNRAKDTIIRDVATKLEGAIRRFNIETGNQPWSGSQSTAAVTGNTCPGSTVASGWAGTTSYPCTLDDLLAAGGYIPATMLSSVAKNPTYGSTYNRTFMFYQCGSVANNKYVLYYYLINPTTDDNDKMTSVATECGHTQATFTGYGMRTGRIIQL